MNIEKYLILNKYLHSLFGTKDFLDLQKELANKEPGYDSDGRSYFVNTLMSLEGLNRIVLSEDTLLRYDENIQSYVKKINFHREPVTLKYFQYLAVLFCEIVLDNLKNRKYEILLNLNEFLEKYRKEEDIELIDQFNENDLKKIAFWMATGSGKTLIMHINYYQFFKHELFSPDNIILITPNEGLSKQHFEELQKSGIPSRLYSGSLNGELKNKDEVLVIEMTKFVEEKKGGGVTLPIDVFEGKNLIFVDEGHKGRRSEEQKWAGLRNKLAENGFVFEYSATFAQILSEKNKEILSEYAKSILIDYSYKYFYLDGYGKDFSVVNVKEKKFSDQEFQEMMFIANLLAFYEQLLVFEKHKKLAKDYNLEKPLWIFVGSTVTGKKEESDVIQIIEFIKRILTEEDWGKEWAKKIFEGKIKLGDEEGEDIFQDRFEYLKKKNMDFEDLYKKVFSGKGALGIYELRNAEGEFGLKVGENDYFGVVNIGDSSGFKKQLEKNGIVVEQDAISGSLFDNIKSENSKINILIGSKKFIEGWDTWRVSSMGLLNIGTGQGPQIIQLFGRGVRLKGRGMSLKRSGEDTPIRFLEMLNIYGIKADYLDKFLDAIRREEVELETIKIPVELQDKEKWDSLYILSEPKKKFEEEEILELEVDDKIHFTVDLLPKISIYLSQERKTGIKSKEVKPEAQDLSFPNKILALLDWERMWGEILEFKIQRNYWNLVLRIDMIKKILSSASYSILAIPEILEIRRVEDIRRLEDIALLILKKYLDLFYRRNKKRFSMGNISYDKFSKLPIPKITEKEVGYLVQIDRKNKDLIEKIRNLAKNIEELLKDDTDILPRINFHGSIYVPILLQSNRIEKIFPAGLVESEKEFVLGLKKYLKDKKEDYSGVDVYLLRNYPLSGIGFQLQWAGFYPDFIMWVKKGNKQTIVFVDPKGLEHKKELDDEKIEFAKKEIKEIEKKLSKENIVLESFILSKTPYEKLIEGRGNPPSKDEYINHHVLFLADQNWAEILFTYLINSN